MADRVFRAPLELTEPVFLYGTLRDPELFEIVGGVALEPRPARLNGWSVHWAANGDFPVPLEVATGEVDGIVVEIDAATRARLDFYEMGFGYSVETRRVVTAGGDVDAVVYLQNERLAVGDAWSLANWQAKHGALAREAAREYMGLIGTHAPEDAARAFPQVKMRAASRLRAIAEPSPEPFAPAMADKAVQPLETRRPYTDFFAVREDWLAFPRFDGCISPVVKRASFLGGDAVTVLPYDPATDSVLLVRQWRHGAFSRGDTNPWTLEPAAGRIDPGEQPKETARREMAEETGLAAGDLHFVGRYYPSPGAFSEYLYSYVAEADLSGVDGGVGGLAEEAEDIMRHVVPLEEALALIETGGINTGPLILSLQWLALNKTRFG